MSAKIKQTIVYDNTCATCSVAQMVGTKLDSTGSIDFVGMHTPRGQELIAKHGLDMGRSAYAISPDGTVSERADMVTAVFASSGLIGKYMGAIFNSLPRVFANNVYDWVSRHRIRKWWWS